MSIKHEKRIRRHTKIRMDVHGTKDRPRLCVSRSNQHIYAQLINDETGKILVAVSDLDVQRQPASAKASARRGKTEVAKEVGILAAKKAVESKISSVVFDRGGLLFHGRVKAVAEGAREGGLKF